MRKEAIFAILISVLLLGSLGIVIDLSREPEACYAGEYMNGDMEAGLTEAFVSANYTVSGVICARNGTLNSKKREEINCTWLCDISVNGMDGKISMTKVINKTELEDATDRHP